MSEGRTAAGTARRGGSGPTRVVQAWRALPHESRLAAYASLALFVTLFLPWYQVTLIATARASRLQSASATITGWGAFSFVEAAVLLVAAGVLMLLFQRAEGRAFHLPGGDGGVITAAGVWTCLLIVWRVFDKQGATTNGPSATSSGVEWGIFIAFAAAAFLAYSGSRIRAAHRPEPPLPGEESPPAGSSAAATVVRPPRRQRETTPLWPYEAPPRWQSEERARRQSEAPPRRQSEAPAHRQSEEPPQRAAPPPRRARTPTPVPAEPPAPSSDRPRRRAGVSELFERVTPHDPPTMPFGRAKPPDIEIRRAQPPDADEPPTTPLGEDETHALGDDVTLPMRGDDATLPLGEDPTLPLDRRPERH